MKKTAILCLIILPLILTACAAPMASSANIDQYAGDTVYFEEARELEKAAGAMPEAPALAYDSNRGADQPSASTVPSGQDRVVIMNASRSMQVNDPQDAAGKISKLAETLSGWVVNSNITQNRYGPQGEKYYSGSISIRIPASKLTEALEEIEKLAVEITSRQQSGQDVTQEYMDLQARLANKEASAEQLRAMIADLRGSGYDTDEPEVVTAKVQALVQLAAELDRIQGEIESMKGQLKYYDESSSYSLITVDLQPFIPSQPLEIAGWHPDGTAKEALEDLIVALQNLADFLIRFGICGIPALLVIALILTPLVLGTRAILRRMTRKPK